MSIAAVNIGWYTLRAGRQVDERLLTMIGLMLLALPIARAWVRHDPEERKRRDRPPQCAPVSSEIGRMTEAEFDRLLDEVDQQMPVSRRRPRRRDAHARGHEFVIARALPG